MDLYFLQIVKDNVELDREGLYIAFEGINEEYIKWVYSGTSIEEAYGTTSEDNINTVRLKTRVSNTLDTKVIKIPISCGSIPDINDSEHYETAERRLDIHL